MFHYSDDIIVITLDFSSALVSYNNNDIIVVIGYDWLICHNYHKVIMNNYIIIFCLVNKRICVNYHTVKKIGGKKLWRIRTVRSLLKKSLAN